jgi:three-Cys-motif partner protein
MARKETPTIWNIEPHTTAKHQILRHYLEAWFPILGRWNGRVMFIDGFAGPGIYAAGEPGSPLIALNTLLEHPMFTRLRCEFVFLFMEPDKKRAVSLEAQLGDFFGSHPKPRNVHVEVLNTTFEDAAESVIRQLDDQKKRLAPTFAFIDPFGFSGMPLDVICRLLSFNKCEVFLNFMYDWVSRFVDNPEQQDNFKRLFGTDSYRAASDLSGRPRFDFLLELYKEQLRKRCRFHFVQSFEMIHASGHIGNVLIYGTRNLEGVRVMKDAMWKVDPDAGMQFSDRFHDQEVLFSGQNVDVTPLREALLQHYADHEVRVEQIVQFVLTETPYAAGHWNRLVLVPLEKDGLITVTASPRLRRYTYPPGTVVRFAGR